MIKINLIQRKRRKKSTAVAGIDLSVINFKFLALGLALYFGQDIFLTDYLSSNLQAVKDQVNTLADKDRTLGIELKKHRNIKDKLKLYDRRIKELKMRSEYVDKILQNRTNPKKVLERLARSIPDDMWFERLIINENKELTISGGAEAYKSISDFLTMANDAAFFGKSLTMSNSSTKDEMLYGKNKRIEVFEIKGKIEMYDPWQQNK